MMNFNEEKFVIDSPQKANWAIKQIKEDRERTDIYIETAKAEIEELKEKISAAEQKHKENTDFLKYQLDCYLDSVPAKKTKTQMSFELPNGKIVRKLAKKDYEPNEEKLLAYIKANASEYLKVKENIDWANFKKTLDIVDDKAVIKETGEIVDCIEIIEKPETVEIK